LFYKMPNLPPKQKKLHFSLHKTLYVHEASIVSHFPRKFKKSQ
jgi:hypothetical protein